MIIKIFFNDFEELTNKELADLKRIIHVKEPFSGYEITVLGNPMVTLRKVFVNAKRLIILSLKRIANVFRKLLGNKPVETVVYKKRRVLFRSMAKQFMLGSIHQETMHLLLKLFEIQNKGLIELWKLNEATSIEFQKNLNPESEEEQMKQDESLIPKKFLQG